MADRLRLLVCQHYIREVDAVVRAAGFTDVTVASFADLCMHPQAGRRQAAQGLLAKIQGGDRETILLGACFMSTEAGQLRQAPADQVVFRDQCFHLLVNREIVDGMMAEGAYLVTPGWIENWKQHIERWGFDRPTAREFFQEATTRVVLLDTGVLPDAGPRLAAFGEFLQLPVETVPVGLGYLTLEVERIVQRRRLARLQARSGDDSPAADKRLADYSMAFDLLGSLAKIMSEEEASRTIAELFTMLFGARHVLYVPLLEGEPGTPTASSPDDGDSERCARYLGLLADGLSYAQMKGGFCLRVNAAGETLGIVGIEGLPFPERRSDYLNLALGVVGICGLAVSNARAITKIQQTEAALRRRSAELERSNDSLTQFAHVVSHDLQEPLRTVTGFVQLLQRRYADQLDERANQYIDLAVDGSGRMRTLITDLLLYSRVGTRGHPLIAVDLQKPLDAALGNLHAAITDAKATVTADPMPVVLGDEMQLVQLLQNLVGNAIKFRGERDPEIHVGVSENTSDWQLTVRDNGIGIDMDYAGKVFEVFKRLHGVGVYPGSGVGLAVCRRIVERHGGHIWLESTPGKGSSFSFTLQHGTGSDPPNDGPRA